MSNTTQIPSNESGRFPSSAEHSQVWIISDDEKLRGEIRQLLDEVADSAATLEPAAIDHVDFWKQKPQRLTLVVLDVNGRLDWGLEVIRKMRTARIKAPMVVLTESFSREFGAKIISQGVRYYFSHDYCKQEFLEVARSLIKPKSQP